MKRPKKEIPGVGSVLATLGLGVPAPIDDSLATVEVSDFNQEMHQALEKRLGPNDYAVWIYRSGVLFGDGSNPDSGVNKGRVYVPNEFFRSWLNDRKHPFLVVIWEAFAEKGIMDWEFVEDASICDKTKEALPPAQQELPEIPEVKAPVKARDENENFRPGLPPAISTLPTFDSIFVGGNLASQELFRACQEIARPNGDARMTSIVLHGQPRSSKKTFLLATIGEMLRAFPKLRVFYCSGKEFQRLFTSSFSGGSVKEARLAIFKQRLFSARVLVVVDIDGMTKGAKGTRQILADAIQNILGGGGRVFVSMSQPPSEEILDEPLFQAIKDLPLVRAKRLETEHYPEVARRFLEQNPSSVKVATTTSTDEILQLAPEIVAWLVSRAQEEEDLAGLLSRLAQLSFSQGGLKESVTLSEAQELLGLSLNVTDLISFVAEKYHEGDVPPGEELPDSVLDIISFLAVEVADLDREKVARFVYPATPWSAENVTAGISRTTKTLTQPEARLRLRELLGELQKRFSLSGEKLKYWLGVVGSH